MLCIINKHIRKILVPLKHAARQFAENRFELTSNVCMPNLQPDCQIIFFLVPKKTDQFIKIILFFIHSVRNVKGGQFKQTVHSHCFG